MPEPVYIIIALAAIFCLALLVRWITEPLEMTDEERKETGLNDD